MDFIIGGAYQGKLDYAKKRFDLTDEDVFCCSEDSDAIDLGRRCIYRLEEYTLWCVKNNADAVEKLKKEAAVWENGVLICCDIFCGVVPLGADMRAWREETGRLCAYLSREAATVTRIFCGLEQKLK